MGGVRQKEGAAVTLLAGTAVLEEEFKLEMRVRRIVPERDEKRLRGKRASQLTTRAGQKTHAPPRGMPGPVTR